MFYAMLTGFLIVLILLWKDKKVLSVNFEAIKNFLALMVLLTFLRLFLFSVLKVFDLSILDINEGIDTIPFWRLGS